MSASVVAVRQVQSMISIRLGDIVVSVVGNGKGPT